MGKMIKRIFKNLPALIAITVLIYVISSLIA